MHWSPSCSHLRCLGFSWPFRDHAVVGRASLQAIFPSHSRELQELRSQGMLDFAVPPMGQEVLAKSRATGRWQLHALTLRTWPLTHNSLLRGAQIPSSEKKLSSKQCLRCTENLLDLTFILSQQSFAMTSQNEVSGAIERQNNILDNAANYSLQQPRLWLASASSQAKEKFQQKIVCMLKYPAEFESWWLFSSYWLICILKSSGHAVGHNLRT